MLSFQCHCEHVWQDQHFLCASKRVTKQTTWTEQNASSHGIAISSLGWQLQQPVQSVQSFFRGLTMVDDIITVSHKTDKQQLSTGNSTKNKGQNAANNTLKRNFPTLMFHQKNRCYCMQFWKLWVLSFHRNSCTCCRMFQQDRNLHWQDLLHGAHVSSWLCALVTTSP